MASDVGLLAIAVIAVLLGAGAFAIMAISARRRRALTAAAREKRTRRRPVMPADPAKRLARHQRYNASAKGQARNKRYEEKHPERKTRWETARNTLRPRSGY